SQAWRRFEKTRFHLARQSRRWPLFPNQGEARLFRRIRWPNSRCNASEEVTVRTMCLSFVYLGVLGSSLNAVCTTQDKKVHELFSPPALRGCSNCPRRPPACDRLNRKF